jgi:predicted DNA-binding transcriptional regulator AlpA
MTETILTAAEVSRHFRISLSTLKRWVFLSRRGGLDFPMPIGAKGSRLRWRREDVEAWNSRIGNGTPPQEQLPETPAEQRRQADKVSRGLQKIGVNINKKGDA